VPNIANRPNFFICLSPIASEGVASPFRKK
jgi:hypothetical protein